MRTRLPVACFQSSRTGHRRCQSCGETPAVIHIPIHWAGYYCSKCCPVCNQKLAGKG